MAIIKELIPPSAAEIVRDRIADIVIEEFAYQQTIEYSESPEVTVTIGKFWPEDKTELPLINVAVASGSYIGKSSVFNEGNYIYNLDAYASAKSGEDADADYKATMLLDKLFGMLIAIFSNPGYDTLGFPRPSITRVTIQGINIVDPATQQAQDAISGIWGRMQIAVAVNETPELMNARLLEGYDTKVKIGESGSGYVYVGNE